MLLNRKAALLIAAGAVLFLPRTVWASSITYHMTSTVEHDKEISWSLEGEEAEEFRYLDGAYDVSAYDSATAVGSGSGTSITVDSNGEYTVFALAKDGTRVSAVVPVTTIDNTGPDINLTSIERNKDGVTYTVHYTASDGFSVADTRIISGSKTKDAFASATPIGGGILTDLEPGEYTIFAEDEAGNISSYPFSLRATESSSEWSSESVSEWSSEWSYEYYGSDFHVEYMPLQTGVAEISKQDITTGKELPGAKLELLDKELGEAVDEWTSGNTPHYVKGLTPGRWYTLKETTAPQGYEVSESIDFQVKADGTTTRIVMMDAPEEKPDGPGGPNEKPSVVEISKKDITNGNELPGAQLEIVNKETGESFEKWTSGTTPHYVRGLTKGIWYTLIETTAPDGFEKAESVDFKVNENGTTTHVIMYDSPKGPVVMPAGNAPAAITKPKEEGVKRHPQTGGFDERAMLLLAGIAMVCIASLGVYLSKKV